MEVNRKNKYVLNLRYGGREGEACFTSRGIAKLVYYINFCVNNPACIYLFKFNNVNTRTMCEICSKLTITTLERRQLRLSDVFIVNFKQILHGVWVLPLLTLDN